LPVTEDFYWLKWGITSFP